MAGSYAALYYHIVFSTKHRLPLLTPEIAPRVHAYIGGIVRGLHGIPLIVGGTANHIHLLGTIDKTVTIADALREIKADSSKWLHRTFPDLRYFAWQEGYGAFSVSVTGLKRVKLYIARQEEHHGLVTFKEEFRDFLHRHRIPYDERYIWL